MAVYPEFRDDLGVVGRKYTITHSDDTGDLFVTIGRNYAYDKVDPVMRDEVLLSWHEENEHKILIGSVLIDGDDLERNPEIRYEIFNQEMPKAIKALIEADMYLFQQYPELMNADIIIIFDSADSKLSKVGYFGKLRDYTTE